MSEQGTAPHARAVDDVLADLDVRLLEGLSADAVRRRRREHGPNRLREAERRSAWRMLLDQVKSVVLLLLAAAGVVAFATARWVEGIAISAVVVVNAAIGFATEWRARRSMEALRRLDERTSRVRRGGRERTVAAAKLVPGDILLLEAGDLVPADARLAEANRVRVDESALTGESVAVEKRTEPVAADAPIAERSGTLFKGTTLVEGSAAAIVTATGMDTEIGRVSELAQTAESDETPLEKRLDRLGARLAWITIGVAAVVAGAGLLAGQPTVLMIETAIALGVAAIPEGLPIVATIALARGMWRMARHRAIVRRLSAVETLGATRVICSDKTGTLTENRMTLRRVVTPAADGEAVHEIDAPRGSEAPRGSDGDAPPLLRRALEIGALCSNATLGEGNGDDQGDPTEIALVRGAAAWGLDRAALLEERPEEREESFDPDVMMMATFHRRDGALEEAVKGAPSAVLEACARVATPDGADDAPLDADARARWAERAESLAGEGLRVLAVADRRVESADVAPYEDLRFVGFVGLLDPPREDVRDAIRACQDAGVRVVMVTGDQPATARAIGAELGIAGDDDEAIHGRELAEPDEWTDDERRRLREAPLFARVSPEQKLGLVSLYQAEGEVVAMTGDGVNDAPALKKADIGVAMGERGTDAAREVSDMVLQDDALGTVVTAVRQGRVIFGNIRRSVMFMLCTNVAEVMAVAFASLIGAPVPLLPLQILYLNVLTDVFPALALGVGEGDPRVMKRPPRDPQESVLTRAHWIAVFGWGLGVAGCVLTSLAVAQTWLGFDERTAVTVSFLTIAFAKLWFVFVLRSPGSSLTDNDVVRNPWIWAALAFCAALLVAAVHLPGLDTVLRTRPIGLVGWAVVLGVSLAPFLVGQAILATGRSAVGDRRAAA